MGQTWLRLRVVCDTTIVVSALLFSRGNLAWMRKAWREGQMVPLVCRETVTELVRVLAYPKFRLDREEQQTLLGDFLPYAEVIELYKPVTITKCRDPHDQVFLELALTGRADALVTGDRDLLMTTLGHLQSPSSLTPITRIATVHYTLHNHL